MAKTIKKDKTISVSKKGLYVAAFEGMGIVELCRFLYCETDRANSYCGMSSGITTANHVHYERLALCYELHEKHFCSGKVPDPLVIKVSRTEAIVLWTAFQETESAYPLLRETFMKLHQKLH